jgi:hypothetical protein
MRETSAHQENTKRFVRAGWSELDPIFLELQTNTMPQILHNIRYKIGGSHGNITKNDLFEQFCLEASLECDA